MSDVEAKNPFTTAFWDAVSGIYKSVWGEATGPQSGMLILDTADFDALRGRMLAEEFGRWFWTPYRRKRPDMTRRSVMVGGIRIVSVEAIEQELGEEPRCPHHTPPRSIRPTAAAPPNARETTDEEAF